MKKKNMKKEKVYVEVSAYKDGTFAFFFDVYDTPFYHMACCQEAFHSFYDLYRQAIDLIALFITRSPNEFLPNNYEVEFILEDEESGKKFIFVDFEYEMSEIFVGQKDYDFDRPIWKEIKEDAQ